MTKKKTKAKDDARLPAAFVALFADAGLDQLVNWLADLRAMRDELAAHGVDVEGSLSIHISL